MPELVSRLLVDSWGGGELESAESRSRAASRLLAPDPPCWRWRAGRARPGCDLSLPGPGLLKLLEGRYFEGAEVAGTDYRVGPNNDDDPFDWRN